MALTLIRKNLYMNDTACYFCDSDSKEMRASLLGETDLFRIHLDPHPVTEGHILIIPKEHITCIGAYSEELREELRETLDTCMDFVQKSYGSSVWFEHGIFGQTISHSHIHVLPFEGGIKGIVPEGDDMISFLDDIEELTWLLDEEGGYLAVNIKDQLMVVDTSLASPRFFRDRFAIAVGAPERGDWRAAQDNKKLLKTFAQEGENVRKLWEGYEGPLDDTER